MTKTVNKLTVLLSSSSKYSDFAELTKSVQYGKLFGQKFKQFNGNTLEQQFPDDFLHITGKLRYALIEATDEGL